MENRILYRPEEAAEALGVSRARLYQLLAQGEIVSVKVGYLRRIPKDALLAYIERLSEQSCDFSTREKTVDRALPGKRQGVARLGAELTEGAL